jgi:hypothetical protein
VLVISGSGRGRRSRTVGIFPARHRVDQVRVAQLPQRLALDQSDPLAAEPEHLAGLAQAERLTVLEPVAQRHHVALALVEDAVDRAADLLAEQGVLHLVERGVGVDLLDEIAELGVLAHGRLERERLASAHLGEVVDLLDRGVERLGQLLARGLATHRLGELEPRAVQLAEPVVDVDGQPDRARAVGDRARDALADPPRRVRRELEPPAPVEQLDGAHQADVPLLDQVEERQPLTLVLAGHGHDQSEVGHDESLTRGFGRAHVTAGLRDALLGPEAAGAEALLRLLSRLDGHGELDLFLLGEQRLAGRRL